MLLVVFLDRPKDESVIHYIKYMYSKACIKYSAHYIYLLNVLDRKWKTEQNMNGTLMTEWRNVHAPLHRNYKHLIKISNSQASVRSFHDSERRSIELHRILNTYSVFQPFKPRDLYRAFCLKNVKPFFCLPQASHSLRPFQWHQNKCHWLISCQLYYVQTFSLIAVLAFL